MQTKVQRGSHLRLISTRRVKSVIIKLKQWVRKLKNIERGDFESRKTSDDAVDHQNASNENKFNVVRSKMAYTVEELRDIVDDNLANELREIQSRTVAQE